MFRARKCLIFLLDLNSCIASVVKMNDLCNTSFLKDHE